MADSLRIALIAPIAGPVRADAGSSIEHLVFLLAEELLRRGHEVTLFATGDSCTSARLHAVYERGYNDDWNLWNYEFHEILNAAAAFERAGEFDLIHSHSYHYALPFTRLVRTPVAHTCHINPNRDIISAYARYPEAQLVAVSRYHRSKFKQIPGIPVIYNGVDTGAFPFSPARGDYLLFLGHLIEKKGPVEAIQIARRVGMRLVMAGHGDDYFRAKVTPLIDGRLIEYVGPVGVKERDELLAGAGALLFPINHSEPFGLVLIEAMACGTPVAATERCAVPEIVESGVTGHYAPDVDSLASLIPATLTLDRARVRQRVEARFNHHRMADEYESLYRCLLDQGKSVHEGVRA